MFTYGVRQWICIKTTKYRFAGLISLLAGLCAPVHASVQIVSMNPSVPSPQLIGQVITFTATATDSDTGPLMFQFNVTPPGGTSAMVNDFNVGTLSGGVWTSQPFVWAPTSCANVAQSTGVVAYTCQPLAGTYSVQVIATDFPAHRSKSTTVTYKINPLVTGSVPVVVGTANPLVALFSSPTCPKGSQMRVAFQPQSQSTPASTTNWLGCHSTGAITFQIAGMYPSTTYNLWSQTKTNGHITKGPTLNFTTGPLPANTPFPTFQVNVPAGPQTYTSAPLLLVNPHQFGGGPVYPNMATDLAGNVMWYYAVNPPQNLVMARPLTNGTLLTIQSGPTWNPSVREKQLLVQIDLAGNIVRKTNTGIIQQELVALGAADGASCSSIPKPPPVGAGCLDQFHHDAIQTLPNGGTAVIASIEKIFPPGTQGDTSGLPVDVIGDMFIVLDSNWHAIWYFDTFEHTGGAPQLDINRPAVRGETCGINQAGCPPLLLLGTGVAPLAKDWLHANSIYYWPKDQNAVAGQLIFSTRNQDWIMKVDYQNGSGTGNILWRMGPDGDFTFNNIANDPWPWFSGQHEAAIEKNGKGPMSIFDNGNSRLAAPPLGLGPNCGPDDCNSRGMALAVNESTMTVTPVLSVDLGINSVSGGNAQLLPNSNYFFSAADAFVSLSVASSFAIEILPTPGTIVGTQVLNVQTTEGYRGFRMVSFYSPPIT